MSVAVTIDSISTYDPASGIDKTQSALIVEGALTLSGTYGVASPPSSGDTIDWSKAAQAAKLTSNRTPRRVEIFQVPTAHTAPIHYSFVYGQGTDRDNGVVNVIDTTTGLEITLGSTYPSALTNPNPHIRYRATFPLFM